jgi:hypothetical protein
MQRHIIKLTRVPGTNYTDAPITIDEPFGVQIIGTGVVYAPEDSGDAITASGANLDIVGLTISDIEGSGVRCTGGALTLQQMSITKSSGYGVNAVGCNVSVRRTDLSRHPAGAIFLTGGVHEIRNNVIHDNGNSNLETGVVRIVGASGRMRFNTIVNTLSRGGGQRIGGISCSELTSGAFAVAQNIIVNYGAGDPIGGTCTVRDNFIRSSAAEVQFASATDFHLTAQSPVGLIRDDSSTVVSSDCSEGDGHIDDVDGEARPYNNFCDRGADEYRP